MMIRKRMGAVALGLGAVVLMGWLPITAQEPASTKTTTTTALPAPKKQSLRVPNYFGQIGLAPDQKAKIYAVMSKRQEKIEALEKQIATERAEMLTECEAELTETQKKLLENLRKVAAETRALPSKTTETPKKTN